MLCGGYIFQTAKRLIVHVQSTDHHKDVDLCALQVVYNQVLHLSATDCSAWSIPVLHTGKPLSQNLQI